MSGGRTEPDHAVPASAGDCDVAEFCSDASDDCPANGFKPAGAACGSSADNACTDPDTCKGGENTCLPNNTACSFVTNSELCSFDYDSTLNGRQFNAIFTPDPQLWPGYKLNATNPGQFYYNAIVTGAANTAGSVTMQRSLAVHHAGSESGSRLRCE